MLLGRKAMTNLHSILKSKDITLPTKVCLVKAIVFPVHVWMWDLDYKKSWVPKNWCFWIVLKKIPLDYKEIQPVNSEGNQSWLNVHWKDWCWSTTSSTLATWCEELTHWKRPWCWERLKAGEEGDDRGWDGWMASPTRCTWVEQAPGVGDGQGCLARYSPWSHKESDATEWLNWTEQSSLMSYI